MAILRTSFIASALAFLLATSTEAHVTLSPKYAEPGQNLTTAFHVPHGCNGSATTGISVTVPEEITVLAPEIVNNWTLTTTYRDDSNTSISTISWAGGVLASTDALDFPIIVSVPNADLSTKSNVTSYFPVLQTCQVGATNWNVTGEGEGEPAPTLVIVKNATQAAADAIAIKNNSTASAAASAAASATGSGAAASQSASGADSLLAGVLPFAAAVGAIAMVL